MRIGESVVVASHGRPRSDFTRHAAFGVLVAAAVLCSWGPLTTVMSMALQYGQHEHYSHIVAIPFVSLFVIYLDRHVVLARAVWAPRAGGIVVGAGIALAAIARIADVDGEGAWTIAILSTVIICIGAFVVCYGTDAFRKGAYPLLLLVLMAPLPPAVLQGVIAFLQRWSAEASAVLFGLLDVPVYREGFLFALPGITIEIAAECSGIRSSLALLIMSVATGHIFLRSHWARGALAVIVVPLAIVKNAVRIVGLSLLAIHVDPSFITDSMLHRYGGMPTFVISLAFLGVIVRLLQKTEARVGRARHVSTA